LFLDVYRHVFEVSVQDEVIFRRLVDFLLDNQLVTFETRGFAFFKRFLSAAQALVHALSKS
jgi:hypothetical protein